MSWIRIGFDKDNNLVSTIVKNGDINPSKWSEWDTFIYEEQEQIDRLNSMQEVILPEINAITEEAVAENGYNVTLLSCTCPDFRKRKKPCKHMYRLAYELKKLKFNRNFIRTPELIIDFDNGFSKDWYFTIGTFHKESFDIKYTTKVVGGEKVKTLTQGDDYSFNVGAVFMDNSKAYELIWRDALKEINFLIQVRSSYKNKKKISFDYEGEVLVVDNAIDYGTLTFDLFKSNHEALKLEFVDNYAAHADEFVKLLKTGCGIMRTGEKLELEKLK